VGLVIHFDDPLPVGFWTCLTDDSHPLTVQRMMGVNDPNMRKGSVRLGGILLRIIPLGTLTQQGTTMQKMTLLQKKLNDLLHSSIC
jgi:hypothetical protein